jgi:hypothetical protein
VDAHSTARFESDFIRTNVALLLQRFAVFYYREDFCIEYFIKSLDSTETISYSLVFSYRPPAQDLHVSRFHPELYRQPNSKYLSAACFYLIIHHCADAFSLDDTCHISLETVPMIYESFYRRLRDFDFQIDKYGLGDVVKLASAMIRLQVDTSMIKKHIFREDETPFLT